MSAWTTALLLAPVWTGFLGGAILRRPLDGLFVALGGSIVLFGGARPARARLRIQFFRRSWAAHLHRLGHECGFGWWPLLAYVAVALIAALLAAKWFDPGPPERTSLS